MEINYLAEIIAFERWLETNYLPIPSQLLWYKMMNYFNRSGWSEWVIVDNLRLMAAMSMGREATFIKARDELIKAGRIIYQKGRKGSPNKYKMVYFTFKNVVKSEVYSEVKSEVFPVVESEVQSADIYKHKQKQNKKSTSEEVPEKPDDFSSQITTIRELYNSVCGSYPRLVKLSEARKKAIRARLRAGYTVEDFRRLFETAEESDFLKGKNRRNWSATFDWLIADANMAKVLDGNYRNPTEGKPACEKTPGPSSNRFHNFEQRAVDYDAIMMERTREFLREGETDGR